MANFFINRPVFANDCLNYSPKFGQAQSTARIRAFRKELHNLEGRLVVMV